MTINKEAYRCNIIMETKIDEDISNKLGTKIVKGISMLTAQ